MKSRAFGALQKSSALASIRVVTIDAPLLEHRSVHKAALAVHPDMLLCAEVPLLAFAGLVHLWVARVLVLIIAGVCCFILLGVAYRLPPMTLEVP